MMKLKNSNTPKISVIVPVYNTEKYLKRCIDSILAQSFSDFELLLIDDGSTDASPAICDEYAEQDSRVRVFHKSNGGVSSARNLGLDNARGEWIAFVDSDDWIESEMLYLFISKAEKTDSDIVFCDFKFVDGNECEPYSTYGWGNQGLVGLEDFIISVWTCLWGSMHKKKLYIENQLRSPEGILYCEDFNLIVKLCFFAKRIEKIDLALYNYRQQAESIMHNLTKRTEQSEISSYLDVIKFLKFHNAYDYLKRSMAWRTLKATQELVLSKDSFDDFIRINPDKSNFIWGCPYIGNKLKIIMWLLTHNMRPIAAIIIYIRSVLQR